MLDSTRLELGHSSIIGQLGIVPIKEVSITDPPFIFTTIRIAIYVAEAHGANRASILPKTTEQICISNVKITWASRGYLHPTPVRSEVLPSIPDCDWKHRIRRYISGRRTYNPIYCRRSAVNTILKVFSRTRQKFFRVLRTVNAYTSPISALWHSGILTNDIEILKMHFECKIGVRNYLPKRDVPFSGYYIIKSGKSI